MPVPSNKQELRTAIEADLHTLCTVLDTIPPHVANNKVLEAHSKNNKMSINDLLAYLIGWGNLVLLWIERKDKGLDVDFPATGYKWNELGQLAQKFYADYEHLDFETRINTLKQTTSSIIQLVESKSNEVLYKTPWYKHYTLGRMIQLNTSSPFKNATIRIKAWKKKTPLG